MPTHGRYLQLVETSKQNKQLEKDIAKEYQIQGGQSGVVCKLVLQCMFLRQPLDLQCFM